MATMNNGCNTVALEANSKTSTGLQANVAGALSYVLGWVTGIVFLVLEKENKYVRFHAIQSIVVFGAVTVAEIVFSFIPFVGWILNLLLGIGAFVLWIVLILRAYQGRSCKIAFAGNIAEQQIKPKA